MIRYKIQKNMFCSVVMMDRKSDLVFVSSFLGLCVRAKRKTRLNMRKVRKSASQEVSEKYESSIMTGYNQMRRETSQ